MRHAGVVPLLLIAGAVASVPREPRCPPPGGRPDATGAISFDSTEVDQDAVVLSQEPLVSGALPPARAVAQFVIDSTGRADPGTLSIVPGGDCSSARYRRRRSLIQPSPDEAMQPVVHAGRFVRSGAVAGAASAFAFAALHHLLISDIWFSLIPMMLAGALCGLCVGWTYRLLFNSSSAATWLVYNLLYVAMFVLLGVASVIVYDPVTTIPALIAAKEPPRELFRQAMPLTVVFTILSSCLMALLWGRTLLSHAAILLTCTILVGLLGLNVSVLGLVHVPSGTAYLIAELFGLILVINLAYVAVVLMLEKKTLFRLAASEGTGGGLSTPPDEKRPH